MNKKTTKERAKILQLLVEGNSLRSTARIADCSINTVLKLLVDAGQVCQKYHDAYVRNLPCTKIQVDEMHGFVGAKRPGNEGTWLWIAMCPDTKLVTNWLTGDRDLPAAIKFMADLKHRLKNTIHLVSDGLAAYQRAVELVFGEDVKFSQLVKQYDALSARKRYKGALKKRRIGKGEAHEVSTSYIERQNLTVRMGCRRMTRKTNAFSKKLENHNCALALHFMHYNFVRVHGSLRVTPAMQAGLCGHVWSIEDLVALIDQDIPDAPKPPIPTEKRHLPASHFRGDGRGRRKI